MPKRQNYRSSVIITTTKTSDEAYEHDMEIKDNDDYFRKTLGIKFHMDDFDKSRNQIEKDHETYLEMIRGRKKVVTKISIETKIK